MNAIRIHQFGGPEVLSLEDVPTPQPAAGQVLLRVKAAGVNPVETYIRSGKYGPKPFPFTPGNDAAGTIESVGAVSGTRSSAVFGVGAAVPDLSYLKPGARVYVSGTITGSYAEFALCNVDRVHPLPERVSFQQGATIGVAGGTAWRGLFQRGGAIAGETVLIHGGAGGVGTAAVQLARAAGLIVVATAGSEDGRRYLLRHGAHHAVGHDVTDRPDEVKSLTAGKGFDLILEMLANKNLAGDLAALAPRGRVVVIGSRGPIEIDPRQTMTREADIRGLMLGGADAAEHRQIYSALTAALENGTFVPFVGMELPLSDAAKAHVQVMEGRSHGKIVLIP